LQTHKGSWEKWRGAGNLKGKLVAYT